MANSDTDTSAAIQSLDRAIQDKQPVLHAAQARRDAARQLEAERRKAVSAIEARIKGLATEVHLREKGAYLNGRAIDRGVLTIGNEALRFAGWCGAATVPLQSIQEIDIGTSHLSRRAGVPILGRILPGPPRQATTLLLTVRDAHTATDQLVVVADLLDAQEWASQINSRQSALSRARASRDNLAEQQEQARAAWREADVALKEAQVALRSVEDEIGQLRAQQNRLRRQQSEIERARDAAAKKARAEAGKGGKR